MGRHFGLTKAQQQADWLARFSDALTTRAPHHAGRIDWDTARHFYFTGVSIDDAVDRYCRSHDEARQ